MIVEIFCQDCTVDHDPAECAEFVDYDATDNG